MMNEKTPLLRTLRRVLLLLIAAGIVVLVLMQSREQPKPPLPVYGAVPGFSLVGEDGSARTLEDFVGKIFVADFIFTRCGGVCPVMSGHMQTLQAEFANQPDVRLVSITVDPEYDTEDVLRRYAEQYGAMPQRWIFLTGEKTSIYELSQNGFRLGVSEEGGTAVEPIIHSTKFVLVDRQSRIRGYYDGLEEESVRRLIDDVKRLVKEVS